ncbi:MAG: nucleotidyltransferase domain-containing protein [Chitinophagales bacterium]
MSTNNPSTKVIGDKLRILRMENKLPLRKVAALIDIDVAILSKMERGERRLTKEIVKKLAKVYNHDTEELLVLYLSEKVIYEIGTEDLALKALKVAEEQLRYMVYKKMDSKAIANAIKKFLNKDGRVKKAWLFGSFSRGEDDYKSDIDVMIQVPKSASFSLFDITDLQYHLEKITSKKIDLVMHDAINQDLMKRIKPDLKVIYERSKNYKYRKVISYP